MHQLLKCGIYIIFNVTRNVQMSVNLLTIKEDDFLGVQNYTRTLYGPQGQLPAPEGAELTQMDYEVYP